MIVNEKEYPMWSQFIERKDEWIGGLLKDIGDSMDRRMGFGGGETEITDITLEPNGEDSVYFSVTGKDFSCGFDAQHGGVSGVQEFGEDWLTFSGYGGHTWAIKQKEIK